MNRHGLLGTASLVLMLVWFTPALAQNQPPNSDPKKTENSRKVDEAKEKERKEKARKDEEARLEAQRRNQAEQQKRRESDEAKAREDNARRGEERKNQERKNQERKEIEKKEQDRKDQDRKHEVQRKEDDRKREEERRGNDEERRKQEEARLEAQKRRQVERQQERQRARERHDYNHSSDNTIYQPVAPRETVVIVTPQPVVDSTTVYSGGDPGTVQANGSGGGAPAVTASASTTPVEGREYYRQPPARQFWASVLCAPGGPGRKPAVGFQYLTNKNYGVGVWFSGSLGQDSNVIDATIPHDDYYTESRTGTMGLEALCCVGSDAAMLVFGAGVSVDETTHTDISNATGWKWNGGSSTVVKPAAQVGCRFRLGGRVSLQFGYDTAQSGFFGLSAGF